MEDIERFDLMMQAYSEIAEEERDRSLQIPPASDLPSLTSVIADISPIPDGALFLGMAEDDLPVLLNLYDSIAGPLLVAADPACGKTNFLKMVARGIELMHSPANLQYCIITRRPNEWRSFKESKTNAGIHPTDSPETDDLLKSLTAWAHNNKGENQSIVLLIDDLEPLIKKNSSAEQNLRWLLLRGPSRRVWTIATINSRPHNSLTEWLDSFRTRFFGYMSDVTDAQNFTGSHNPFPTRLNPVWEFAMREGKRWLRFWIPNLD